jgi:hypothetical protein
MRKILPLLATGATLLGVVPLASQQASVARLVVSPAHPEVMAGDSVRLTAQALDSNGSPVPDAKITFKHEGLQGASLDEDGLFRAGARGTMKVVVSAIVPGAKPVIEQVTVRMLPGPAARIEVGPHPALLIPSQRFQLQAQVFSGSGDLRDDAAVWTSSSPGVARVSRDGMLEARGAGRATLTAAVGSVRASAPVEVRATAPASVAIEPAAPKVRQGDVVRFALVARDARGKSIAGLTPSWSFSPGKGQIDPDGVFVAYEPGTYTVTATLGNHSAVTSVTVGPREVRRRATIVGKAVRKAFPTSEVWVHPNGKVLYLGTHLGGDRFYSMDISDPANPVIVDSVQANTRLVNDIMTDKEGKVLVFTREGAADRKNGLVICTLDDPLHPKVVSEFTDGVTAGVHSAFVFTQPKYGTHVYLTNDGTGALHILDINDPAHPREVARWKTPRPDPGRVLHDVDVQDGLLYASYWDDGLVILDIGNGIKGGSPSNPQLVSQYKYDLDKLYREVSETSGPGFIRGTHTAWRHGRYVFVADEVFGLDAGQALFEGRPTRAYGRLHVVDVSDLEHPREVAWYEPEYGGVHNVWVAGDTLYMGAYNAGFRTFDVSGELRGDLRAQNREIAHINPTDTAGFIPNAAMTWGVVVKNNLAYVNDFNNGLFVVRMEPRREPGQALTP